MLTLNVRLIPNPGDGIVQVLADLFQAKNSTVKNILDTICAVSTVVIGFVFAKKSSDIVDWRKKYEIQQRGL